ncbi:Aste57867_414 [Aphanomyces stellatus]|uniref:Aste57867_414 protein n=1 Tax=Aphanomyces stellatus TaxID=120398 RepID=A0A485K7R3_9STRA|nr:hypothetical protein As57867_000413 [Aphanomyces stellatus]VFT77639.1 Aste57867_414 [Aphanomyces stellatus]
MSSDWCDLAMTPPPLMLAIPDLAWGSSSASSDASSDDGQPEVDISTQHDERCGYRTGKCLNARVVKRNGSFHKLCEMHREKANWNQKKLDRKKRLAKVLDERTVVVRRPTSLGDPPRDDWGTDEVAFFCQAMTPPPPALPSPHRQPPLSPNFPTWDFPTEEEHRRMLAQQMANHDDELDLLFKSEVMVLVDQWAPH